MVEPESYPAKLLIQTSKFSITSLLCQVYVTVYAQQFFMTIFSLTSLKLLFVAMLFTQRVQCTAGQRTIGLNFFVDHADGAVFTLSIFSTTSALVKKLACYCSLSTSVLVIEKIGKVARMNEQIK